MIRTPAFLLLIPMAFLSPSEVQSQDIFQASREGRLDKVQTLVASDPTAVHRGDSSGYTALRWASIRGHREVLRFLIDAGSDPNSVGADGGTALHGAAHHDDPEMMNLLLDAGGDFLGRNQWGRTALHVAARRGCARVAGLLLDRGADPNAVTNEGWSTLSVAYRGGHPAMVELLLARGADPQSTDTAGLIPGEVALVRPDRVVLSPVEMDEYLGHYDMGSGFGFRVWREGARLRLMEFSPNDLVPVGVDTFYCAQEPWRAVFRRDTSGEVSEIEVDFLRRTVVGRKVRESFEGFTYVGSGSCISCHSRGPGGGAAGLWIANRHSRALHTLTTDQALTLAGLREEYRDIQDPAREDRCLRCHATGAQDPSARFGPGHQVEEGVGCEACHGPGSVYMDPAIMRDRDAFLASGGRIPGEFTCRGCHRDGSFRFSEWLERIRHW